MRIILYTGKGGVGKTSISASNSNSKRKTWIKNFSHEYRSRS
ncbi:ArsA-related P-loop ATPase [Bacillus cereus]